jgi:hypothetical protein
MSLFQVSEPLFSSNALTYGSMIALARTCRAMKLEVGCLKTDTGTLEFMLALYKSVDSICRGSFCALNIASFECFGADGELRFIVSVGGKKNISIYCSEPGDNAYLADLKNISFDCEGFLGELVFIDLARKTKFSSEFSVVESSTWSLHIVMKTLNRLCSIHGKSEADPTCIASIMPTLPKQRSL